MKKLNLNIIVIFSVIFILIGTAFADRGVFNAKVTPDEMLITDSPKNIKITAEIGSENFYISSVQVYRTTASGQPIGLLCKMYDDGTQGDEKAADTIFTGQFSLNQPTPESYYVRVTAVYRGYRNRYMSPVLEVKVYEPIPYQMFEDANETVQNLNQSFFDYLGQNMDLDSARQLVLQNARNNPDITEASLHGNTLFINYANRISCIALLDDPNIQTDGGSALDIKAMPGVGWFKSIFGLLLRLFLDAPPANAGEPQVHADAPLPDNLRSPGNNKLLLFVRVIPGQTPPLVLSAKT